MTHTRRNFLALVGTAAYARSHDDELHKDYATASLRLHNLVAKQGVLHYFGIGSSPEPLGLQDELPQNKLLSENISSLKVGSPLSSHAEETIQQLSAGYQRILYTVDADPVGRFVRDAFWNSEVGDALLYFVDQRVGNTTPSSQTELLNAVPALGIYAFQRRQKSTEVLDWLLNHATLAAHDDGDAVCQLRNYSMIGLGFSGMSDAKDKLRSIQ